MTQSHHRVCSGCTTRWIDACDRTDEDGELHRLCTHAGETWLSAGESEVLPLG